MRYILQDIIYVRDLREDRAAREVSKAMRQLEDAFKVMQQKKEELNKFREWRITETERLYQNILQKKVFLRNINDIRSNLSIMQEQEIGHEKAVMQAEDDHNKRKEELNQARASFLKANRDLKKIEEHRDVWLEEKHKEEEYFSDLEMEEFMSKQSDEYAVDEEDLEAINKRRAADDDFY